MLITSSLSFSIFHIQRVFTYIFIHIFKVIAYINCYRENILIESISLFTLNHVVIFKKEINL